MASRGKKSVDIAYSENFTVSVKTSDLVKVCAKKLQEEEEKAAADKVFNDRLKATFIRKVHAWISKHGLRNSVLANMVKEDAEGFIRAQPSWGPVRFEFRNAPVFDRTKIRCTGRVDRARVALKAAQMHRRESIALSVGQAHFYFGEHFGKYTAT